jgi:hypothetical protein
MGATGVHHQRHTVQAWLGDYLIVDWSAEQPLAERYAEAMRRRFPGLRVTIGPIPPAAVPTEDRA